MLEALQRLHPGCSIWFGDVKMIALSKNRDGNYETSDMGTLKLAIK